MKIYSVTLLSAISLLMSVAFVSPAGAEIQASGAFMFTENFNNADDAAKKLSFKQGEWQAGSGELKSINAINRLVSFNVGQPDWNDYEIEFKIKRLEVSSNDQHFGIFVRNGRGGSVRLYCRGDAIIYIAGSSHDVLGKLTKPMAAGSNTPWAAFRITVKGKQVKVFADNVLVGTIDDITPIAGDISFYAYNLNIAIAELKIMVSRTGARYLPQNESSRNILHNSSFEQSTLDNLPDYWGCNHWGLSSPYWVVRFEEWQKRYGIDSTVAFDGKNSMRIDNPGGQDEGLRLRSVCVNSKLNEKYVLSAYMKSDTTGMKVKLHDSVVVLTSEWQRYSTGFVNNGGNGLYSDTVNICLLDKGVAWIDAVQLEKGELTPYQMLKDEAQQLAVQEGNTEKTLTEVPKYTPAYNNSGITLDGRMDEDIWQKTGKIIFSSLIGESINEPAEARVWYSDHGIYIGVKCFTANATRSLCKAIARDQNVWDDPSVEIFLDPKLTRSYYYHMAINQTGVRFDAFCGDMSWNGQWQSATYTDPAGKYWSAEVFLPFGELGVDQGVGEYWGFNLGRNNPAAKETSCWAPTFGGFHNPTRFGQIRIDRKILEKYFIGCSNAEFQRISDDASALTLALYDDSGSDGNYEINAKLFDQDGKSSGDFIIQTHFAKGERRTVTIGQIKNRKDTKYSLLLNIYSQDNRTLVSSRTMYLENPDIFSIRLQYSLYTMDKEMRIRVRCNLSDGSLAGSRINFEIRNSEGKTSASMETAKIDREMETAINLTALPEGAYEMRAVLYAGSGRKIAESIQPFRKLPPVTNEVRIDHFARIVTVNGKPFIPTGFSVESNRTPEVLAYYGRNGCNSIGIFTSPDDFAGMTKLLDSASQAGIKVRICISAKDREKVVKFMQAFKTHPALLAWDIFDEVFTVSWGKNNYQFVKDSCIELKDVDLYHPVFINENQYGLSYIKSKKLNFPGDIISIDYYAWPPAGNFPVISSYVKLMGEMGVAGGKPCWVYLLGGGYAFWASRDYTPEEQEFSTYASIINGASGIFYFADHPKSKSQWERIKRMMHEIKELTPVIAATENVPVIKCNNPAIEFMVKKDSVNIYIIAVNNSREKVDARFDLTAQIKQNGRLEVLFENRKLELQNNVFADWFDGFQRHVYKLSLKE